MTTTSWIFNRQQLTELSSSKVAVDPEIYCLTAALCAFVIVQAGMNLTLPPGSLYEEDCPQTRRGYANMLLADIVRIRKTIDYVETPTLSSLQISFFLFGCYFSFENQNTCWFHLREAATLAQMMSLHDEATYLKGDPVDSMYKRRTYWLLLVTERAYALERHRPLTLHPTIELPKPQDPHEEDTIGGFISLIKLFCCIDDEFMGLWNKSKTECSTAWLAQLQQQLRNVLPADLKTTESQAADIRITLHWLRIMVWQLSITNGYLSSTSPDTSMTFKYPIEVARDLIQDIKKLSQGSMEVHGIGLIEKLFDVACTLADVISCVPLERNSTQSHETPSDYLNYFISLISHLHGGSSRYLPLLMAKVSENLPIMAPSLDWTTMNIKQGYAGASDNIPTPTPPDAAQMQFARAKGYFGTSSSSMNRSRPMNPHVQTSFANSGLMFNDYSPADTRMSPSSFRSTPPPTYPAPVGQPMVASAPRSVPSGIEVLNYEGYPG
jgi:hypothetical protein